MEFTVSPSPSFKIVLGRYDAASFPKLRVIFEEQSNESPLRLLAQPRDEAEYAVVMENFADKDVTALHYQWVMTDENRKMRKHTVSSDSYMVDVHYPVLRAGDRMLICRGGSVNDSLLDHVLSGGGIMGSSSGSHPQPLVGVVTLRLEIDMVLFADGEIAGPDTDKFALELLARKPAAEFVAKQIRSAQAEGRDVVPVLSALAAIPCFGRPGRTQGDPLVHWTRRYASDYLHAISLVQTANVDMKQAKLRYLENRPTLPRFYRAEGGAP